MLISLRVLKKYISLPSRVSAEDIKLKLTTSTVEVEKIETQGKQFEYIVVGRVTRIAKHPNADKLKLVLVSFGPGVEQKEVVCGGTNLHEGMLVAFAQVGAMVRLHGQGDLVKLEKATIRGIESDGMICSAGEIGLADMFSRAEGTCMKPVCEELAESAEGEVVDLTNLKLPVGEKLARALGLDDVVFHIDNKSLTNRPDLWSHYGIARELGALYGVRVKSPAVYAKALSLNKNQKLKIVIQDKKACPRYIGAVIANVEVAESPAWLKKELAAVGMKSINNIVDVTNYVLMEIGQPLHAFDISLLRKGASKMPCIMVRKARAGETITLLDEEEKTLTKDMLVITDARDPVALAGIMGGMKSGIHDRTTTIVLEAANFDAMHIRRTSQALNIHTESSIRFEKALHPKLAELGMRRAVFLIKQLLPEAQVVGLYDRNYFKGEDNTIRTTYDFIEKRIGQIIGKKKIDALLTKLGFTIVSHAHGKTLRVRVPWWRATGDISIPEDLVEEVARMYGYDRVMEKQELVNLKKPAYQLAFDMESKIKTLLSMGCGMQEVFNYPWAEEGIAEKLGIVSGSIPHAGRPSRTLRDEWRFGMSPNGRESRYHGLRQWGSIELINPPAGKNRFLQNTLMPNLVKNVESNLRFFGECKLFELSRVYRTGIGIFDGCDVLPAQPKMLAGVVAGDAKQDLFFNTKGIVESIGSLCEGVLVSFAPEDGIGFLDPHTSMRIMANGRDVGYMGAMHDATLRKFDFHNKGVALFELDFEQLVNECSVVSTKKYQQLPKYPAINRDIAICAENDVRWQDMVSRMEHIDPIVAGIEFLSVYDLGNGKKSVAFRVTYRSDTKTLQDSNVVAAEQKIIRALQTHFHVEIR